MTERHETVPILWFEPWPSVWKCCCNSDLLEINFQFWNSFLKTGWRYIKIHSGNQLGVNCVFLCVCCTLSNHELFQAFLCKRIIIVPPWFMWKCFENDLRANCILTYQVKNMYYCFHVVFFLLLFVSPSALKMYYIQDLSVMFFKHVVYSLLHGNVALPNKTFHIIITVLISPHVFFSLLKKMSLHKPWFKMDVSILW